MIVRFQLGLHIYKKKANPNGAIPSIKIDLLNKNPIIMKMKVFESNIFESFKLLVLNLLFLMVIVLSIKNLLLCLHKIVAKKEKLICHFQYIESKNFKTSFLLFDTLSLPNYRIHLQLFRLIQAFPLLYPKLLHQLL